jgi:hypothetical protein
MINNLNRVFVTIKMSEPAVDAIGMVPVKKVPNHNLLFKKSEEKRLDDLFQSKCHSVSIRTLDLVGWHYGLD